ncbi:MAG TPA: MauE/DoxX family redox-associated membrane protein [Ktedonobacteraceae bacterium]|nr:MauE/DoxX family redox-associated membrane protein [Ktedonobacteraceae bacterium]
MIWSYVLAFCRVAIGLVFLFSGMGKLRDLSQFQRTITNFRLLPAQMSYPTSLLFVSAEVAVVLLIALGGKFLLPGFLLALLLLLIFVGAIISVITRQIQTPCNCFGSNEKPVTQADIWRDTAFLLCAFGGSVLTLGRIGLEQLELLMWLLIGGMAIIFVLTVGFLDDIVQLFR